MNLACGLILTAVLVGADADGANREPADPARLITPATQAAIDSGTAWLVASQQADGSFGAGPFRGNVAVTGLAGLAMIAGGSPPGRGPHGAATNRCVDYLLAQSGPGGFIESTGPMTYGPMYGHGFATLFLAECHGMSPRDELRDRLVAAVRIIVNAQNNEGGWRYTPRPTDADVSVTVCQVMALRAARNAGVHVPDETIARAVAYLKRAQNSDGGFTYMLVPRSDSEFPRSAGAAAALYSAGIRDDAVIDNALRYVEAFRPGGGKPVADIYYEYGHYYACMAMWQAGGQRWQTWYPAIRDELIARQLDDGSWNSMFSRDYATAMSLVVLQTPNGMLPIFQR